MRKSNKKHFRLAPLALACASFAVTATATESKLDPALVRAMAGTTPVEALIELSAKADAMLLDPAADPLTRRRALVSMLQVTADQSQADLLDWLKAANVEYKAYWINNTIWIRASAQQIEQIARRGDVRHISANRAMLQQLPQAAPEPQIIDEVSATEWSVSKVRAPEVWSLGFNGQGVVISGQDTGYRWDHNALKSKYRGWNGTTADHNYNWHDAITTGGGSCGPNSQAPCDDHGHGTHTMGTMVGDDGGSNQVGMAPGAKWIACRNMNVGTGTPQTYIDCMQWLIAPTDLAGLNADPSKAPDIISNSWGCPSGPPPNGEGCDPVTILQTAVDNLVNAGIFFAAAAANDGPSCSTITAPPALYDSSFVVGSTTSSDAMSDFSSRGPVIGASLKPDVVAPGSSIRSASRSSISGYTTMSGTSMATPNVAGAAALLMSVNPALRGHPDQVAQLLRSTAVPISNSQTCGGIAPATIPNFVQGWGRIDVYAAAIKADTIFADKFQN